MNQTTKNRIINWARWARGGPGRSNGSMTGYICDQMRAARGEMNAGGPNKAGDRLDSQDAELVERAWKRLQPMPRELLRWHYIREAGPGFICRRMGIKPRPTSILDIELARAEAELGRMLEVLTDRGSNFETHRAHAREGV